MSTRASLISMSTLLFVCGMATLRAADLPSEPASLVTWPQVLTTPDWKLRLFHPHAESMVGDRLNARSAFGITLTGQTQESFGVVWLQAHAQTDRDTRTITLSDQSVTRIHLPGASEADQTKISHDIVNVLHDLNPVLSLDRILVTLADAERDRKSSRSLSTAVPTIIVTDHASLLVYIDGEPKTVAIPNSPYLRIINSPYQLVQDAATGANWLHYGNRWYTAARIQGPWSVVAQVPDDVARLAPVLQGFNETADARALGDPLDIVVSEVPAELVYTTGAATYEPVDGTNLLAVTNSPNELFLDTTTNQLYLLLAGRWFQSGDLEHGTWALVKKGGLPLGFSMIPPDSKYGTILASVPGTVAAEEAALDAQVTQSAAVKRSATIAVSYDGAPQFQPIPDTPMSYAVNTADDVILASDHLCYCCNQGIWYQAPTPNGPWTVATALPPEIGTIPPDNPLYNDTFCHVYDSTPDYVYDGYSAGYFGSYLDNGCVVWGTGFPYNCWWGGNYYPRQCTWGFGMAYNPWTGHWGAGLNRECVGNNGWFAFGINGATGGWWGPGGYRPVLPLDRSHENPGHWIDSEHLRPEERPLIDRAQSSNLYRRSGNSQRVIASTIRNPSHGNGHRGDGINASERHDTPGAGTTAVAHEPAEGHPSDRAPDPTHPVPAEEPVFPGTDGGVYRKETGGWQQWQREGWQKVPTETRPSPTIPEHHYPSEHVERPSNPPAWEEPRSEPARSRIENLEEQRSSEQRGIQRSQSFQQYRSSPPASMYQSRGGGGGMRR